MLFTTPSAAQLSTVPCGVDESKFPAEVQALMAGIPAYMKARRRRTNAAHMRICRLVVEVDSELYRFYDRDTNRIAERIRRQAAHYRIQLSENGGFSWLVNLISTCNGISLRGLPAAAIWYVRIKSANGDGESDWSNVAQITVSGLDFPRLKTPAAGTIFEKGTDVQIAFDAVDGATGYDFQVVASTDAAFHADYGGSTGATNFTFRASAGIYNYRVRAKGTAGPGPWSEVRHFSINPAPADRLMLPFDASSGAVPRSFPFRYEGLTLAAKIRVTIAEKEAIDAPFLTGRMSPTCK